MGKNYLKTITGFVMLLTSLFAETDSEISAVGEVDSKLPIVEITYPATGDELTPGTAVELNYTVTEDSEYSPLQCQVFINNEHNSDYDFTLNSGETSWDVPNINPQNVYLSITATDDFGNAGEGNSGVFSIGITTDSEISAVGEVDSKLPIVEITYPATGDELTPGTAVELNYTVTEDSEYSPLQCQVFINNEHNSDYDFTLNSGETSWDVPNINPQNVYLSITATDDFGNAGEGNSGVFSIGITTDSEISAVGEVDSKLPEINVLSPDGGELLFSENTFNLLWSASDQSFGSAPIDIYFSSNNGGTFSSISTDEANDGSYPWTVPEMQTVEGLIRVEALDNYGNSQSDVSASPFTIVVSDNWHISTSGSDETGDGSEMNPFSTIQKGIDAATDGDMILVADGTYTGTGNKDLSWSGLEKHLVIRSENGPENCIIDLENDGRAFTFNSTPTQLWITREDVIEGFTIRNGGNVTYGGAMYLYYGYNNDLSPTVLNCVFENNSAENGGAVYANGASPLFEYCVFKDNTAQSNGGAVYLASSGGNNGTEILSCTIKNNQASSKAGGIYFSNIGDVEGCFIEESLFKENDAPNGGAMYLSSSSPTLINNLIINNSASSAGPALYVYNFGGPKVIHCTITDNTGGQYAVYNHAFNGSVNPMFINTIIWGNSGNVGPEGGQNAPQFQNCNVGDGLPTGSTDFGGNMDVYAEFNDPYVQDYHLQNISPMIGAGMILEPDVADGDMDGNPRPNPGGSNPDIGCFESDLGTPESDDPDVTINYPNGGEIFPAGEWRTIQWTWTGSGNPNMDLYYSDDSGMNYPFHLGSVNATDGEYNWQVPNTSSSTCRIKIEESGNQGNWDESDFDFTIQSGGEGGFSYDFGASGSGASVVFGDLDYTSAMTFEAFVKFNTFDGSDIIFFEKGFWGGLKYDGPGQKIEFHLEGIGEVDYSVQPSAGEWYHLAADYDGGHMYIYWNGMRVADTNAGGSLSSGATPMMVGDQLDGLMDIVRISDVARYQGVSFDPWNASWIYDTPTRLLWHCNEGSGNQLVDDSGFSHHGELWGTPTWSSDEPLGSGVGQITFTIHSPSSVSGNLYYGIFYSGNIEGDPDIGMGPFWHDFSTGDFYGNLSGIVEGNGYTFGVFFDKDGSPNIGADYCDEGDDMGGMLQNISVWGMSDIGTVELGDCSGFNENEYSYDFEMGGSVNVFDGPGANDLDGATDFSVEFFIMFHANPGTDQILFERLEPAGSNNDMELRWDNSNQHFELSLGTEGTHYGELFAGGMDPFDSNWHHIYIQYLSGLNRLEFFWDGALASNTWPTASNPFMPSSDYPLRFGTDLAASVDEVRIRKVSEDWGSSFGVPGDPYIPSDVDFNTIVLWHCDENEGTQLTDDGYAQNNPGIVEGTGAWDGSSPWVMGPGGNVWWEPNDPQPNTTVTIHYDVIAGTLPDWVSPVYMNIGYNGFQNAVVYEMTHDYTGDGQDWWKVDYMIPWDATDVSFEFQDAQTSPTYVDDNEGYPWVINIGGGTGPSWINISQPNASSSWTMGTGESIQWTSDSPGDYWVDIDLYKDGGYIESIYVNYQSAPNGDYWWSIPNTLNAGGNYQVRIKDTGSGLEVFSDNFEITGGGGQEGVISGQISLNEEWASAQVRMVMWFPTSDPQYDPPDMENSWGEDPPFDVYREYFRSTDIVEGGPYKIKVYFDANNNNIHEENEPGGGLDIYVPASQIVNDAHITLSLAPPPTISGEITYDGNYYSNATIKIIVYEDPAVWPTYGEGVTQIVLNGPFNFGQTVTFTIDDPALGNNCCYRLYAEFDDNSNGSGTDAERWFPFPIDLSEGSVSGVEIDLGEEGNWIIEDLIAECGNSDVAEGNWDNDCYEGNAGQMGQIVDNDYGTSNGIGGNLNFVYEFSLANGIKQINHIEIINGYPNDAADNDCNWMSGGTIELWDNSNSEWDLVANINNSNLEKTMVFEFPAYETDRIQFRITDVGAGSGCHPEVTEIRAILVGSTEAPNNPPIIVSGAALTTPEETPIEITLSNLTVTDSDNNYPGDFTLTVLDGDNYSVDGTTITPELNFNGELTVPVYVDDGESENSQSNTYSLTVTVEAVNDAPIIVSGAALTTPEETPIEITLSDLTVTDSDNTYPGDFTLTVLGGDDYIVDGTTITPELNFNGELTVPVYVDDGESENSQSNTYSLTVTVEAVNDAPVVTNSLNDIVVDENWSETITVNLENFFDDPDIVTNGDVLTYSFENTNPSLFEVTLNGAGIEVSITPEMNGSGELIITAEDNDNVTISDTMMVTVLSIMELDRNGIAFHATETSGEFIIQNLGDNPLYLTSTFEWTLTPNWLTMDVVQGEISAATDKHINVTVSPTGQAEGVWIYIYGYRDAEATDYVDTDTLYMSMDAWSDVGPVITNIQYSPTTPTVGSDDVTITGSIESANEVSSVELYYNNGTGFKSLEVVSGSAVIPSADVTHGGLIFYIYALDNLGYETTTQVQFISVGYPSFTISQDTKVQTYTMISVPGELNNRSVASLLEDELGPYDPTQWRLFTWNGSSQTYDEHPLNLDIGTGYWLITDETHTLNGGAGTSTDLAGKTLELTAGWNMIGNPYHFNINLSNLTLVGDVEANLYKHNGSGYDQTQDMNPGIGYWIWAGTGGSLVFNPGQSSGGTTSKVLDINDQGWTASIAAFTGHVDDKLNIFGVHPDAQDEKDTRDYHEPPVIGNYIRVAFDNTGWETAPGQYSTDIRAENQDVKTWEMSVKTNVSGIVSLHGVDMANIPADLDAILVDLDYGSATDLRDSRPYRFTSNGGERTHPFAVIVGHPEDVEREMKTMGVIPNQFDLAQNTPNPFNPVTSIRLSLPEESNVSLTVFNLLGEEVARIAYHKAMEAGSYRMIWNGRTHGGGLAPSGVYLYMVDVQGVSGKHFRKTRKMILIK